MVCPLKELDTSALSVSPRRLTEGVLEVEGPTSADAGVASCLLFDTEPEFKRLRDDFWDGIVFVVGTRRLGGIELPRRGPWECSRKSGALAAHGNLEFRDQKRRDTGRNQKLRNGKKTFLAITTKRLDLNIYIVGAGA